MSIQSRHTEECSEMKVTESFIVILELIRGILSLFAELWLKRIIVDTSSLLDVYCLSTPITSDLARTSTWRSIFVFGFAFRCLYFIPSFKNEVMIAGGGLLGLSVQSLSMLFSTFFLKPDFYSMNCLVYMQSEFL